MSLLNTVIEAAEASGLFRHTISRVAINHIAGSTPPRPRPLSLWSHLPKPDDPQRQGPVNDYTSWPGLTDRSWSGRHLPPAPQADIDHLPAQGPFDPSGKAMGPVLALFARGSSMQTDRSSVLFSFFAQWFTDSFLRTGQPDRRRNTSNHEIDLCQIYGLTEDTARLLRSHEGGQLRHQIIGGEVYPDALYERAADGSLKVKAHYQGLPYIAQGTLDWILQQQGGVGGIPDERRAKLYATGLERGNSSIGYAAMSTLFLREHNRLCQGLQARNPSWDDERLFQTARMINIVQLIRIVVEDYINHIAGHRVFVFDNSFAEAQPWYRTNWMSVEFDLVYRWHGLVPDTVNVNGKAYQPGQFMIDNALLESLSLLALITGASQEPAGKIGLFNTPHFLLGAEYQSVKMGRDFRLQGFNDYRERFGMDRLRSWDELTSDARVKEALQALYKDIDKLELVIGLLAEEAKDGALFGGLLNTMVAVDAFTQALTNPLLASQVYTAETFSAWGLEQIQATPSLQALVDRNVKGSTRASFGHGG